MSVINAISARPDEREYVRIMKVSIQRDGCMPYEHCFISEAAFNEWIAAGLTPESKPADEELHAAFAAVGNTFDGWQGIERAEMTYDEFIDLARNMDRPLAVAPNEDNVAAVKEMIAEREAEEAAAG